MLEKNNDYLFVSDTLVGDAFLIALLFCLSLTSVFINTMDSSAYQQIGQSVENTVCIEMDLLQVGSEPVGMRCPFCQEDVMTKATYRKTTLTHVVAFILGIFFWWLCCCIVPYATKRWKNVEHYCPRCRKFLGVYVRSTILKK